MRNRQPLTAWRTALLTCSACIALAALGAALAPRAHSAVPAGALTDPPTTTEPVPTTPTTTPTPDPAPPPAPKPKPKPAPAPRSHVTQHTPAPVHVQSTPVYSAPTPAAPVQAPSSSRPAVTPHRAVRHVKRRKHVVHRARVVRKAATPDPFAVQIPLAGLETSSASASLGPPSSSKFPAGRVLIVGLLGLSLLMFAFACVPARIVPWRPVAHFIYDRHADVTLFGVVLLTAAGVAILLTRGH